MQRKSKGWSCWDVDVTGRWGKCDRKLLWCEKNLWSPFFTVKKIETEIKNSNNLKYLKFWRDHFRRGHHAFLILCKMIYIFTSDCLPQGVWCCHWSIGSVNVVGHAACVWWCGWDWRHGSRRRSQSTRVKPALQRGVSLRGPTPLVQVAAPSSYCRLPWTFSL